MSAAELSAVATILDEQYEDFRAMHGISMNQRNCLVRSDLPGLNDGFDQMHACMGRIRLRESRLPLNWQGIDAPEVVSRRAALSRIIGELDRVRQSNEQSVRDLLQETRSDLKRCQVGQKAVKSYLSPAVNPQNARFYDGRR